MKSSNEALSQLRDRMREGHPTFKDKYGSPSRGVAAGLNEAFIIDRATHDAMLKEDPNAEKILKPFIQGKNLKRWRTEVLDSWLIYTPKGKVNIDDYPAVKRHLLPFKEQLEKRDGEQQWFELEDAQAALVEQMTEAKIGFANISERSSFFMDVEGAVFAECSFFTTNADYYLAGLLNSDTYWFLIGDKVAESSDGSFELLATHIETLPIPDASGDQRGDIGRFADHCLRTVKDRLNSIKHFQGMTAHNLSPQGVGAKLSDKLINWFFLDFADFRNEVIKTFGQDIPEDDLELWENYFGQEKAAVMTMNAEIFQAETRIEEVVYEIFGLTKADVSLIQRS